MNILIIHHYPGLGGATLSCYDVAKALTAAGHDITISVPNGDNAAKRLADQLKLKTIENSPQVMQFTYHNGSSGLFRCVIKYIRMQKNEKNWEKIIDAVNPDLVLLNSSVQWPMIKMFSERKIKCILLVRETMRGKRERWINRFIRKKYCQADGVAFLTEYDLKQWLLPMSVKQTVIPDSVDINNYDMTRTKMESRKLLELKENEFYVLYVGGINSIKGAKELVTAMQKIRETSIKVIVLGDLAQNMQNQFSLKCLIQHKEMKYVKNVYKQIKEINRKEERILLKGLQSKTDDWFNACDVVVFPAGRVHQARPLYEAGVFRKAVILPDYENFRDNAENMNNVLYYQKKNSDDLAEKIEVLFNDRKLLEKLGNSNKVMTEKNHMSVEVNKQITRFVEEVYYN